MWPWHSQTESSFSHSEGQHKDVCFPTIEKLCLAFTWTTVLYLWHGQAKHIFYRLPVFHSQPRRWSPCYLAETAKQDWNARGVNLESKSSIISHKHHPLQIIQTKECWLRLRLYSSTKFSCRISRLCSAVVHKVKKSMSCMQDVWTYMLSTFYYRQWILDHNSW